MTQSKKTQTDKPRKYHAEFRLTESWRLRDDNPDKRRYHVNYESKFKPKTDEHTIDFWEEVLNCFGPLKTPYDEKIRLYRKSDDEAAPLNEYDDVDIDSCEAAFKKNESDVQNDVDAPQDNAEEVQSNNDADKADNVTVTVDNEIATDNENDADAESADCDDTIDARNVDGDVDNPDVDDDNEY